MRTSSERRTGRPLRAGGADLRVEPALDAGERIEIDVGEAERVRGQRALRIDAAIFGLEADAGAARAPCTRVALAAA